MFIKHMSKIHNNPVLCQIENCHFPFHSTNEKNNHMAETHPELRKSYNCHMCQLQFPKPALRKQHQALVHGKPIQCWHCDESFLDPGDYEKHRLEKHPNSRRTLYSCDLCDVSINSLH